MGQAEVLEVLKKEGGWLTVREIAEILNQDPCNIRTRLYQLRKYHEIFSKYFPNPHGYKKQITKWSVLY